MTDPLIRELKKSALAAARDARHEIAPLMQKVAEKQPDLAKDLSGVVATLFSAEVGDPARIHEVLDLASTALRELLESPDNLSDEGISKTLSRTLALIHPARTSLGRGLGLSARRDESTAPFLLTPERVKPSGAAPDDERRAARRSDLDVEVGLEGGNRFYTGETGDISQGGLFVATDTPLVVGTELVLSFVLPDGYRVRAEARVAWVRAPRYRPHELPSGMGVHFQELSSADQRALEHFFRVQPPFHYGG